MKTLTSSLSLFTSASTLVCCALPSLLVALGAGATVAGLVSQFPQLVVLSENRNWVFLGAGLMLIVSAALQYSQKNAACPIDPDQAEACRTARSWSRPLLYISISLYLIGAFVAYFPWQKILV